MVDNGCDLCPRNAGRIELKRATLVGICSTRVNTWKNFVATSAMPSSAVFCPPAMSAMILSNFVSVVDCRSAISETAASRLFKFESRLVIPVSSLTRRFSIN